MAQQGWSSLPADLVNRVADCLLASNDLDCYTDMRTVCHHWRSVTADLGRNQHDPRFRPSRWVMLDEEKASSGITDGPFLFVNTSTGRFLRRRLPLLRDRHRDGYVFVTSTADGLLVLVATDPPHAVSVLNPFTGSLLRFVASLPRETRPRLRLTADVWVGSSPTLVLVSVGRSMVYWAEPQSESFSVEARHCRYCPASRLPLIAAAGKYAAAVNRESVLAGAKNIFNQLRSMEDEGCRCYTVVAANGDMLAILKRRRGLDVSKIDAAGNILERVKSIGSLALFLGVRSLVVDTDSFPTVEANCAYFQLTEGWADPDIYKFNIGTCDDEEEPAFVSAAIGCSRPLTVTQVLSCYTMVIPVHPLSSERCSSYTKADCYKEYIDYVDEYSDEEYSDYADDDDDEDSRWASWYQAGGDVDNHYEYW